MMTLSRPLIPTFEKSKALVSYLIDPLVLKRAKSRVLYQTNGAQREFCSEALRNLEAKLIKYVESLIPTPAKRMGNLVR